MSDVVIDAALAHRLVAAQFPHWAALPVSAVPSGGWDNRTFRLGDDMALRLPSAAAYATQVAVEQAWLPRLAPHLPLAIPRPLAKGQPGEGYPFPWSIYAWLPGETAAAARAGDREDVAVALAAFLTALRSIDPTGAPGPGTRTFHRGGPLRAYDGQTREALGAIRSALRPGILTALWDEALAAPFSGPQVWVHGDVAPGNLLLQDGRLGAVIDFGQLCAGDPACDGAIAWTFFQPAARRAFREALGFDAGAWRRARGWALWKAAILVAGIARSNAVETAAAEGTLLALLDEA